MSEPTTPITPKPLPFEERIEPDETQLQTWSNELGDALEAEFKAAEIDVSSVRGLCQRYLAKRIGTCLMLQCVISPTRS